MFVCLWFYLIVDSRQKVLTKRETLIRTFNVTICIWRILWQLRTKQSFSKGAKMIIPLLFFECCMSITRYSLITYFHDTTNVTNLMKYKRKKCILLVLWLLYSVARRDDIENNRFIAQQTVCIFFERHFANANMQL